MRFTIVGGGPAGLYFAILMKRQDPSREVVVFERDGPHDTFGWGIVFSDQTFSYLQEADAPSFRRILASCVTWDNVDIVHRGEKISIGGNKFSGIARITFLNLLQERCRELAVDVRFRTTVGELAALPPTDLLVGADGANSHVRRTFAEAFQPTVALRKNKYLWLGTPRLFHGLTLTFRDTPAGVFGAHSYKFNERLSTFIVECSEATWTRAGFERMSDEETCRYLERVFADDLQGQPLLSNDFVKWINFPLVTNEHWYVGRVFRPAKSVVLLGDALHTAHFSIGSGTKLALEDSIALTRALASERGVPDALAAFEAARRPRVEAYQAAAFESLLWFENMHAYMHLDPVSFAYRLMTRSKKIDHEKLKQRDPAFVARYEATLLRS